jgi:hypothetical protein
MKTFGWIAVAYLGLVGAATLYSATAQNSPTSDTVAGLPSLGSLLGSSGSMAAFMDFAGAGAAYWFLVR